MREGDWELTESRAGSGDDGGGGVHSCGDLGAAEGSTLGLSVAEVGHGGAERVGSHLDGGGDEDDVDWRSNGGG